MSGGSTIEFFIWLSEAMGGLCSKSANEDKVFAKADENFDHNHNKPGKNGRSSVPRDFTAPPQIRERMEKNLQEPAEIQGAIARTGPDEELYDGIPRYSDSFPHKSRSVKSRQAAVAKVVVYSFISFSFCQMFMISLLNSSVLFMLEICGV